MTGVILVQYLRYFHFPDSPHVLVGTVVVRKVLAGDFSLRTYQKLCFYEKHDISTMSELTI